MKRLLIAGMALAVLLFLTACGDAAPPTDGSSGTGSSDTAFGLWTGSFSGDGVEITLIENSNGTVDATIEEDIHQTIMLTVSGNTATAEMRVAPEVQGGDMSLDMAREQFPDIFYTYTLTQSGKGISYTRTMELHRVGELDADGNPFPPQIETFSAELTRNTESTK